MENGALKYGSNNNNDTAVEEKVVSYIAYYFEYLFILRNPVIRYLSFVTQVTEMISIPLVNNFCLDYRLQTCYDHIYSFSMWHKVNDICVTLLLHKHY